MIKSRFKYKEIKARTWLSTFSSGGLHVLMFFLLYTITSNQNFNIKDTDHFEILDAEIIGLVNQTKSDKQQIQETAIVSVKSEDLIKNADIDKKTETKKQIPIQETIKEEIKQIPVQETVKEEIKQIPVQEIPVQETPIKEIEKIVKSVEKIKTISSEPSIIIKEEKPMQSTSSEVMKPSPMEIKKEIKEKIKIPNKIDSIDKNESKKIADIVKKLEDEEEKKRLKELKASLNKANQALNALGSTDENAKNNRAKANNLLGGGDRAIATLGSTIKSRLISCWKIPPLIGIETNKIYVILRISLSETGRVSSIQVVNRQQYVNNKFFDVISDSSVKAVQSCSPVIGLPRERYGDWREIELVFDPSKFLNQ